MSDTRATGQELQDQLIEAARRGVAVARRGHEQVRKSQERAHEQVRRNQERAQEQLRKGQELRTEVVRTVTLTAEAIRPQLPSLRQLPTIKLPAPSVPRLPSAETV